MMSDDSRFPFNGQLEVEIYFREISGQSTVDCRRFYILEWRRRVNEKWI